MVGVPKRLEHCSRIGTLPVNRKATLEQAFAQNMPFAAKLPSARLGFFEGFRALPLCRKPAASLSWPTAGRMEIDSHEVPARSKAGGASSITFFAG